MKTGLSLTLLLLTVAGLGCPYDDASSFSTHRNIAYATAPGVDADLLSLDIYVPDPVPSQTIPVVIWVHGGGWMIGDKAGQMQIKPGLFTGAGYCLVSINYRLSPVPPNDAPDRVMYPIHEEDVAAAIAWVYANIVQYGGNPEKIALMGHSAGAHLVSIVSTDDSFLNAHQLPLSIIKGTVSLDTEGYDIPAHMLRDSTRIYENAFGTDPAVWRQASPVYHVAAGKRIPPFLLVTRGASARRQQCTDFAVALQGAGVTATVVDASGYSHADVNRKIGTLGETVVTPPLMEFLAGCF